MHSQSLRKGFGCAPELQCVLRVSKGSWQSNASLPWDGKKWTKMDKWAMPWWKSMEKSDTSTFNDNNITICVWIKFLEHQWNHQQSVIVCPCRVFHHRFGKLRILTHTALLAQHLLVVFGFGVHWASLNGKPGVDPIARTSGIIQVKNLKHSENHRTS